MFLIGRECPYTCVFCDLWRHTLDGPTPVGALPAQLLAARSALGGTWPDGATLKLYNASSFFDPLAVPEVDLAALGQLCHGAGRVVVECHPRFVRRHEALWRAFQREIAPAELEVGIGLETADPELHRMLGKGTTVAEVEAAVARLRAAGVSWRAFVLVGTPGLAPDQYVADAVASGRWALERGASHIALIPVRGGNGAMDQLAASRSWRPPRLDQLEESLDQLLGCVHSSDAISVATADLWDLDRFSSCSVCFPLRRARLEQANLEGHLPALHICDACGNRPSDLRLPTPGPLSPPVTQ